MKIQALVSLIVATCTLSASAATLVEFTKGVSRFGDGDNIAITGVSADKGTFGVGDTITVKGTCTLATHKNAKLLLSVTQDQDTAKGPAVGRGKGTSTKEIKTGTVDFEMTVSIPYEGWVHLGFYDNATGKPFGQLYFGTREQMARIAHWNLEKNMK